MDITAVIDLAFAVAYLFCAGGLPAFVNTYYNYKKDRSTQDNREQTTFAKEI